nr:hypothetical protein [Tanacetum cinerariifolium]
MGKRKLSDYDDNEFDDDICVNSRPSKIYCFEKGCYSAENGSDYVNVESGYSDDDKAAAKDKVDSVSFVEKFNCDKVDEESCGSCEEKGGNVARDEIIDEECCFEKSCNVNGELSQNKGRYWDTWLERWTNDKAIYDCEGWFIGWREDYSTDDDKGVFVEKECSSCEEKGGNMTGDEKECCYQKSCKVNGELSENKGRY